VRPLRYALDLTLRPDAETFAGRVAITVESAAPTPILWLNADELDIVDASIGEQPARVVGRAPGFIGLAADEPLPAGRSTVKIATAAAPPTRAPPGVFRVQEAGRWYLLSKFESIFARKAFPGFDEPGFKVAVPDRPPRSRGLVARSNAPSTTVAYEDGGMKAVFFAETAPLPTYLVAFCVGPFDIYEAGSAGRKNTPIELLVPAGQKPMAAFAASLAKALFVRLEEYFDVPYPFEKLDLIAAPVSRRHGERRPRPLRRALPPRRSQGDVGGGSGAPAPPSSRTRRRTCGSATR